MSQLVRSALMMLGCITVGVVSPRVASAATYYVAPSGSDGGSCAQASPCQSIAKGASMLSAGDTLFLRGGTYGSIRMGDFASFPSGTSWQQAVTIAGYPGERVVLTGVSMQGWTPLRYIIFDNLVISGSFFSGGYENDHLRLSNSEVYGDCSAHKADFHAIKSAHDTWGLQDGDRFMHWHASQYASCQNVISGLASYFEVLNTKVHDGYYGFYVGGHHMLFDGVEVSNTMSYSFHIYSSGSDSVSDNVVRNSIIRDSGGFDYHGYNGAGILISTGPRNSAENNVIYNNRVDAGIQIDARCHHCVAACNTIYNNTGVAVAVANSTGVIVKDNIFYGNTTNSVADSTQSAMITNNHTAPQSGTAGAGDCRPPSPSATGTVPMATVPAPKNLRAFSVTP